MKKFIVPMIFMAFLFFTINVFGTSASDIDSLKTKGLVRSNQVDELHSDSGGKQLLQESETETDDNESYQAFIDRFITNKSGVVTDKKTGLQWFVGPERNTKWAEAKSWVEKLKVDGGGWRMPKGKEVKTLYKEIEGMKNISIAFKTKGSFVWTCETKGPLHAWGFCFDVGNEFWPRRTFSETARVFAVRTVRSSW